MKSTILEYVWLDGYETPHLRSKIKVLQNWEGSAPVWNFDGSSTQQAEGGNSECLLSPVRLYQFETDHYIVLCEVLDANNSSHTTNFRSQLRVYWGSIFFMDFAFHLHGFSGLGMHL